MSLENGSSTIIATQMSIGGFYYKPKIGELVKAQKLGFEWIITNVQLDKEAQEGDIVLFNDNIEIQLKNNGEVNIVNKGNITINVNGNTTISSPLVSIDGNLTVSGAILGASVGTSPSAKGAGVDLAQLDAEVKANKALFDAHVIEYKAHTHIAPSGGGSTGTPI